MVLLACRPAATLVASSGAIIILLISAVIAFGTIARFEWSVDCLYS